jgi:hypothetical protein
MMIRYRFIYSTTIKEKYRRAVSGYTLTSAALDNLMPDGQNSQGEKWPLEMASFQTQKIEDLYLKCGILAESIKNTSSGSTVHLCQDLPSRKLF